MALAKYLQLQWKYGHVENVQLRGSYDLPGCRWVYFLEILHLVYLIPVLGAWVQYEDFSWVLVPFWPT